MERLRVAVHSTVLILIIGWVLYIGKAIFVPAVLGAVSVYVIVGLAERLGRLPVIEAINRRIGSYLALKTLLSLLLGAVSYGVMAVWAELWGIPGAFLAVPITAILTIVFSEFPATRPRAVLLSKGGRV